MVNTLSLLTTLGVSTGGVSLYSVLSRLLLAIDEVSRHGKTKEPAPFNPTCPALELVCPECPECPSWGPVGLLVTTLVICVGCLCFLLGLHRGRRTAIAPTEVEPPVALLRATPPRGRRVRKLDIDL